MLRSDLCKYKPLLELHGSLLTYVFPSQLIIPAFMGLYMNRMKPDMKYRKAIMGLHVFTIVLGSFVTVSGTYATIQSIIDAYKAGIVSRAFAC